MRLSGPVDSDYCEGMKSSWALGGKVKMIAGHFQNYPPPRHKINFSSAIDISSCGRKGSCTRKLAGQKDSKFDEKSNRQKEQLNMKWSTSVFYAGEQS